MLLATPYFWSNEGKGSYANYNSDLYLEITYHAYVRAGERNVRQDSILALAEMCGKNKLIRELNQNVFCVRYLGDTEFDNIVIPFVKKTLASGDIILYAKTVWRYLNENDDFFYRGGQTIFDLTIAKNGEPVLQRAAYKNNKVKIMNNKSKNF